MNKLGSLKQVLKCGGIGCEKTFQTLPGRSKHHKKCSYQRQVSGKGYIVLEESNKVTCKRYEKVFSVVSNWYKHDWNAHKSTRKTKTKQRKSINVLFAPKNLIVVTNWSDMKPFIQEKPTRVKLVIIVFDTKIITLLMQ